MPSTVSHHPACLFFIQSRTRASQLSHTRARLSLDEFGECIARVAMLGLGRQHTTAAGPLDLVKGMFMLVSQVSSVWL